MSLAPYTTLDLAGAVWQGYYSGEMPDCFGALWTPNPAEFPPGANGWKLLIVIHGGGMRQCGPKYCESGADIPLYFVNNFGCAVFSITYPQGGFEQPEIEHPDCVVWPEHLKPVAHAVQFIKKHAANVLVVGAGGKLSTLEIDIAGTGLSAGGYLHTAVQLLPDGTFPYFPAGQSDDPWFGFEHNHLIGTIRANSGQTIFSKLFKGVPGDFTWDTYDEFTWWGAYFYFVKWIAAGGSWDTFPMEIKLAMEPIGQVLAANPRVLEAAWYMCAAADTLNHGVIKNLSNAADATSMLNANHYTLGVADTDLTSLHHEVHMMRFAYEVAQLGHTRYRLKAGNSTTNPDDGTAAVRNPDLSNSRFNAFRAGPTRVEVVTAATYSSSTVTVTFFKNHALAFNVTAVTYVGTTATITFDRNHKFLSGDSVTVSGVTASGTLAAAINAAFSVTGVPAANQITVTIGAGVTGVYTSGGLAVAGQVTLVGIVSSGTLATLLNGLAQTITAVPAANQIRFVLGSGPTGAYTSGGKGYVQGNGSAEEDFYTFLVDATHGVGWSLL